MDDWIMDILERNFRVPEIRVRKAHDYRKPKAEGSSADLYSPTPTTVEREPEPRNVDCPECAAANPEDSLYCGECGTGLGTGAAPPYGEAHQGEPRPQGDRQPKSVPAPASAPSRSRAGGAGEGAQPGILIGKRLVARVGSVLAVVLLVWAWLGEPLNGPHMALQILMGKKDFSGADLEGASLSEAGLEGLLLEGAQLGGADLQRADLRGANLGGADLREAELSGADLSGANLREADLGYARLIEANLRGALLKGADLRGADLTAADVTAKQLAQAASLEGATMPDGTVHE